MDELKKLKELGIREISLGVECGDDRIRKSIRIAMCRMIPFSFNVNVLFIEQDSIDFEPALFYFVADKINLCYAGGGRIFRYKKTPVTCYMWVCKPQIESREVY